MRNTLSILYVVSGPCWTKLFLRVFQRMLRLLPSWVLSSLSSVKSLDMMEPKYEKFSTVSSASSLRVILAT